MQNQPPQLGRHTLFHSFCIRPNCRFESQLQDELVALVIRAHPILLVPWLLNGLLLLIGLILFNVYVPNVWELTSIQLLFLNMSVVTFILSYYWFHFLSYFFNVGVVSNKRILDIDFSSVLFKQISETRLERIEDITASSGGYVASLFNFGNIYIQTAGETINFEFLDAPRPGDVVRIINELSVRRAREVASTPSGVPISPMNP
jgi:membrane protein YdbS with pleckstrin-like domain